MQTIIFEVVPPVELTPTIKGLPIGIPGHTPYVPEGATTWWINGVDTGKKAIAIDGNDGSTPYVPEGATTWWIDGEDTGLKAIGKDGDDGYTPVKGLDYNDGSTPYIGENGNWWIDGEDTGENAIAPNMLVIEQYVTGFAEPKKGIDDFYVSAAQVVLINDIVNKVTAITGHSLVADTEIAKIHSRNTDSTLLSENGLHSVYIDANGTFHVKNISQVGTTYETHAEQLFTTKNEIILRDGAIAGLGVGEYVGLRAKLYDGVNDGNLVFDRDGWARVGDVGALQKLATIEENPTNGHLMRYNTSTFRLESYDPLLLPVSTAASRAFVSQNGGTIYHITRWFTPTSVLTIAANGLSATITSGQFTGGMTGAKLKLTGGVNEPIITYVNNNTINLSFAVDSAFFGQSVAVADWGVYKFYELYDNVNLTKSLYNHGGGLVRLLLNNYTATKSGVGEVLNLGSDGLDVGSTTSIRFSANSSWYGTKDLGIRRISDGLMEIYNGVTNGALRDLKLRSLFADKIIPNSDTTGVVIRNAADTADVVKVDTATGKINATSLGLLNGEFLGSYQCTVYRDGLATFGNNRISANSAVSIISKNIEAIRIDPNQRVGFKTITPETDVDVNGTTTLRDWVYLNNGTHTGDALDDYRYKVLSGVLTFQKCTTANSVRGNGGWTTVSTI